MSGIKSDVKPNSHVAANIEKFVYDRAVINGGLAVAAATENNTTDTHGISRREEAVNEVREYLKSHYYEEFFNMSSDEQAYEKIQQAIIDYVKEKGLQIEGEIRDYNKVADAIKLDLLDYSVLTPLIFDHDRPRDKKIEEIEVLDYNDIRIMVNGKVYMTGLTFNNADHSIRVAEKIVRNGSSGTSMSVLKYDSPLVKIRLGNNIRATILRDPIARRSDDPEGSMVHMAIRKQSHAVISREQLIKWGSVNEYGDALLELVFNHGGSIALFGGTNCGKTGTMNSYVHRMNSDLKILTVAEIDEMDARKSDERGKPLNRVMMWEIKEGIMDLREAVIAALTFSPECIVLQECKGPEAVEVITAAITGHQLITTCHATDIKVFGKRFLVMYKQSGSDLTDNLILDLVSDAFDIVVQMKKMADGTRKIVNISELHGYDKETKRFLTTTLVEYIPTRIYEKQAVDENGEAVIDSRTNQPKMQTIVEGRHVIRNPISEELARKLMFNGALSEKISRFADMGSLLREKDFISDAKGGNA